MNQIDAYASATSASPGEAIDFHVRVALPDNGFQIQIVRRGSSDVPLRVDLGDADASDIPIDASERGCAWPVRYTVPIPDDWASGIYIAQLTANQTATTTEVMFVVKAAALGTNSKILLQLTNNTAQAYNNWGGKSLYGYNSTNGEQARQVSFDRPGMEGHGPDGSGSDSSYRNYEYHFVRWLEINGFEVEYCTGIDLHADPNFLDNYQFLLSVGHDEYWSKEMRDNVERFVANGGNAAFLSGNVCWWQVRFEDNNRTMVCYKSKDEDPLTGVDNERVTVNWYDDPVFRPGNTMTGVDFRNGAYWENGPIPAVDFQVKVPGHWIFATALNANSFGGGRRIVGYETDAAHMVDFTADAPVPAGDDGTPANFVCLAVADCPGLGSVGAIRTERLGHDGSLSQQWFGLYCSNGELGRWFGEPRWWLGTGRSNHAKPVAPTELPLSTRAVAYKRQL
jgi:hypothetical protein